MPQGGFREADPPSYNPTSLVGYASCHPGPPRTATSIVDLIGNTPLIRLSTFEAGLRNVELYAKARMEESGRVGQAIGRRSG